MVYHHAIARGCVSQHAMGKGGCSAPGLGECLPLGPGGVHPPGHPCLGRQALTIEMTIEEGGAHPTGMHSCLVENM